MTVKEVFELRKQGRIEEAAKILEALKRMLPQLEYYEEFSDRKGAAASFVRFVSRHLRPTVEE